ncbi:hypothetical protein SO694_00031388 [Aureococcus anophagefferens]|uniref:Uncharacterized protein n=1 Tax=Aureococcus anophagefferens TaxID=44056 RepID=A0ABR1FJU3_AURAN
MNRGVTDFGLHDRIVAALLGPAAPKRFVIAAVLGGAWTPARAGSSRAGRAAYDHLRKVRQAKLHDGGSKDRCKDKDVKVCPIDADKPDGFARAAYDGFDRRATSPGPSSHGGQTRAFEGFAGSGPLQLDVDFSRAARARAHLEPTTTGPRPITTANWKTELKVTVEGAPCGPPACVAVGGDGDPTQSLYIDLAKVPDCDECKACWMLQPVHVDLEVSPLPELGADMVRALVNSIVVL